MKFYFALATILALTSTAHADLLILKGKAANQELVQAMIHSKAHAGGKAGYRTLRLDDLKFQRNPEGKWILAYDSNPNGDALYAAIQNTAVAQLAKKHKIVGDCSAGNCQQNWKAISCRYKLVADQIEDVRCTLEAEISPE